MSADPVTRSVEMERASLHRSYAMELLSAATNRMKIGASADVSVLRLLWWINPFYQLPNVSKEMR